MRALWSPALAGRADYAAQRHQRRDAGDARNGAPLARHEQGLGDAAGLVGEQAALVAFIDAKGRAGPRAAVAALCWLVRGDLQGAEGNAAQAQESLRPG